MPCFHPLKGFRGRSENPETGKRPIVFDRKEGYYDQRIGVPCGRCVGCRVDRARSWAVRCVNEASLYDRNCFITLTFQDKFVPLSGSLVKADFQNFMKRLRKHFYGSSKSDVRYFHCGEYGDKLGRPHHHACLFNFDFEDKLLWQVRDGNRLFRSRVLEGLWPYGFCTVGAVTLDSAAYVARYVVKKINGEMAPGHYQGRLPEYTTMSRRPGIGKLWFEKYYKDLYPKDFVVIQGRKYAVPEYYDREFEKKDPVLFAEVKRERIIRSRDNPDNEFYRLLTREHIAKDNLSRLNRVYESSH